MNSREYSLGGITLEVSADLPIEDSTFLPCIRTFETKTGAGAPDGPDRVYLHHHFSPPSGACARGARVYHSPPWKVYQEAAQFTYVHYAHQMPGQPPILTAAFQPDHACGAIFHYQTDLFLRGGNHSLTLFPTDQILMGRVLSERQGAIFHAAGMIIQQQGFLFAGHSGAGKTTLMRLLKDTGEILCDDRNIIRRQPEGWRLYGTWSHGDIPDVSAASAPLRAILLLEQAAEDRLIPLERRRDIVQRLPFLIIKPLVTADWVEKTFDLVVQIASEVPVYRLLFTKSERVRDTLAPLLG